MRISLNSRKDSSAPSLVAAWSTDLHFDAAEPEARTHFLQEVVQLNPDILLIGGDIANGVAAFTYLQMLESVLQRPLYFVLGNHDYYYHSIEQVRRLANELVHSSRYLFYLTAAKVIPLSETTALIGHDGWSDGRAGSFGCSSVRLNDYLLISELRDQQEGRLLEILHALGDEAAADIRDKLALALPRYAQVIILTHTPPFREACLYHGEACDDNWAPHFVCHSLGEVLVEAARQYPVREILVLCGHSHSAADVKILPNLRVIAGQTETGTPTIQRVIEL